MTTDLNKIIGKNLFEERKKKGLSQPQLAEMSKLSTEFISRIERGVNAPSIKTLNQIAKALNVNITTFFDDPEDMASWEIEVEALVVLMKRGDKSIRKVFKLAEVLDE